MKINCMSWYDVIGMDGNYPASLIYDQGMERLHVVATQSVITRAEWRSMDCAIIFSSIA